MVLPFKYLSSFKTNISDEFVYHYVVTETDLTKILNANTVQNEKGTNFNEVYYDTNSYDFLKKNIFIIQLQKLEHPPIPCTWIIKTRKKVFHLTNEQMHPVFKLFHIEPYCSFKVSNKFQTVDSYIEISLLTWLTHKSGERKLYVVEKSKNQDLLKEETTSKIMTFIADKMQISLLSFPLLEQTLALNSKFRSTLPGEFKTIYHQYRSEMN